ncbi:hypothetical protein ACJX0J_033871, partial [Zea mays]
MYQRPDMITPGVDAQGQPIDPEKMQEHFEDFYEDIYEELGKEEEQAAAAYNALQGRFYSGRPIILQPWWLLGMMMEEGVGMYACVADMLDCVVLKFLKLGIRRYHVR